MRNARARSSEDRRHDIETFVGHLEGSSLLWAMAAVSLGALVWLLWPVDLVPQVLRRADSAARFVEVLWQVEATALALSAAIVTFAFATFSSSRVAQMGGSLPSFARSSGLLVGIAIGLVAMAACGLSLLAMPPTSPANAVLSRVHSGSAMAAVMLSSLALSLIPFVLQRSLRAGDRSWLQRQLRERIEGALDMAVALFIEHSYAREIMREVMQQHALHTAPLETRCAPYRAGHHPRTGILCDIRLRRLVGLRDTWAGGQDSVLLNPIGAIMGLGSGVTPAQELIWVAGPVYARDVRRIFVVKNDREQSTTGNDLDRLHAQALAAIRDDDEVWYREVSKIHREVLLHLIRAWRRFGAAPGRAPAGDEVGLRPLTDHLELQVREIIELDREELAAIATEVPLAVGLEALENGREGAGLAQRMMWSLARIAADATSRSAQPTAERIQSFAANGVFMLLRAGGDAL